MKWVTVKETTDELTASIIALDGTPRNASLQGDLIKISSINRIRIVEGIKPKDISEDKMKRIKGTSKVLLGREITDLEVAVAMSHRKCYEIAKEQGEALALVFEDDAVLADALVFERTLNEALKNNERKITTFYSPLWSVWKMRQGRVKAIFPPPGAVAYLINQELMSFALASEQVGLADWPMWSMDIEFELIENSGIELSAFKSYLENSRNSAKSKRSYFSFFYSWAYGVSPLASFRFSVLYPLLWKVLKTLEVCRKQRSVEDDSNIFLGK
jgi:GR25 family glycosyltransferase involved in LPS biosynthesis